MAITNTLVNIKKTDCNGAIVSTYNGVPSAAASDSGSLVLSGTNENAKIDWIKASVDNGGVKTFCVEVIVTDSCGSVSVPKQVIYNVPKVNLPLLNANTMVKMPCPIVYPVVGGWDNVAYTTEALLTVAVQAYMDTLVGAGNSLAVIDSTKCGYDIYYNPFVTAPTQLLVKPFDSKLLDINYSNGSGKVACPPIVYPLILNVNTVAYFDAVTFLAAYQTLVLDATYGATKTVAAWSGCQIKVTWDPTVTFAETEVKVDPLTVTNLALVNNTTVLPITCPPITWPLQAWWTGAATTIFYDINSLVQAFATWLGTQNTAPEYATAKLGANGCTIDVSHTAGATKPVDVRVLPF